MFIDFFTAFFIICGGLTFLIGGIGILRYKDIYSRASSVTIPTGLGLGFFTLALVLANFSAINCLKALLAFFINLAVSGVVSMLVSRSAYASDAQMSPKTHKDELAEYHS